MTRRVVKPQSLFEGKDAIVKRFPEQCGCPYGVPGDRLWVRETCLLWKGGAGPNSDVIYTTEEDFEPCKTTMKIMKDAGYPKYPVGNFSLISASHMPRWASRITLEIVNVRVERLQEITAEDAVKEGTPRSITKYGLAAFCELWDTINGKKYPWASNPWVWVLEFKRMTVEGK